MRGLKPGDRNAPVVLAVVISVFALVLAGCEVEVGDGDPAWNEWAAPNRHDLDMGAYSMHYVDAGQGPPIVMIHGFADSSFTFSKNAAALVEAGYRTIVIDQPGLGRSTVPPDEFAYSVENLSEEIVRLADKLGLGQFHLAGSSMGGGIALYIALHHPDRILSAIVLDPACYRLDHERPFSLVAIPASSDVVAAVAGRWAGSFALNEVFFDKQKVTPEMIDEYARPLNKPGYRRVLVQLIKRYFSNGFDEMTKHYSDLKTPLLIVWGDQDRWVPPAFGQRLHKEIPSSRLTVVKDCGHLPHMEASETVNPIMKEFLGKTADRSTAAANLSGT